MAKKKKDLKRNEHRRRLRRERRERQMIIREAMSELGDLLRQQPEPPQTSFERHRRSA